MKKKQIDSINIDAIYGLTDTPYKYIGIRRTHSGGYLEGILFDNPFDLIGDDEGWEIYTREQFVDLIEENIAEKEDGGEDEYLQDVDWHALLERVRSCSKEEWPDDKVIVIEDWDMVAEKGEKAIFDQLKDALDACAASWGRDYQYYSVHEVETVIKSIALAAVGKTTEIPHVGDFVDYVNSLGKDCDRADGRDCVLLFSEHIVDLLDWKNEEGVLFYRCEIEEDEKHVYVVNPDFSEKVIGRVKALREEGTDISIDQYYIESMQNILYVDADAFSDWEKGSPMEDVEKLIEETGSGKTMARSRWNIFMPI